MTPYRDPMEDGELPAEILEQYPALEPPPDPNRVTAVWLLSVIVVAFAFVLVMAVRHVQDGGSNGSHSSIVTPTLNCEQGCFVQNTGDEPAEIYVAPDTKTTLVGSIEPGDYRRVVDQGTSWHSIESVVTSDWVQASQVVLVGERC